MGEAVKAWIYSGGVKDQDRVTHHRKRSRTPKIELLAAPSVTAGSFKPKKLTTLGHGRRNPVVQRIRAAADPHMVKQPGRRYGPPPESGNCNPGSPAPKGRRAAALAEKHARLEIATP